MGSDVVLLPTIAQAERWRKLKACEAGAPGASERCETSALLGITVATYSTWLADLWELHGDGRMLIDGIMRRMLMRRAFKETAESADSEEKASAGLVAAAASCAASAVGLPLFDQALADLEEGNPNPALDPAECRMLEAVARYLHLADRYGLVEPGEAASLLAARANEVFPFETKVRFEDAEPLDWHQRLFVEACEPLDAEVHTAPGAQGIGRVPEGVRLRFAYPSGPSAQAGLVADIVRDELQGGASSAACASAAQSSETVASVVVACKDPLAMHSALEKALVGAGAAIAVRGRIPFSQTDFGRTFLAMYQCLHQDALDRAALTDVLLSAFSGLSKREAYEADRAFRKDRIMERESALAPLRASHEAFSQLEELASDPDADVLIGVFEQMVQARIDCSAAWRSEQLAALSALRKVTTAARAARQDIDACAEELEQAAVPVSFVSTASAEGADAPQGQTAEPNPPDVLVVSQSDAAALGPHACRLLVATDLTTDDYPVADREDAVDTLLGRLGLQPWDDALSKARRRFTALMDVPSADLVLMRPLNDASAAAAYPCLVLDELIDAYRADPTATDDVDNIYSLPQDLQEGLLSRSEDALFENASALAVGDRQHMCTIDRTAGVDASGIVLLPRRTASGEVLSRACPSPSAIESYLECPHKWFIDRRLDAKALDEDFGPLEKGSFAHEVLQTFYERFQATGQMKVNAGNLEQARAIMQEVLDECEADQVAREPGEGRLVPATELERRDMAAFKRQLLGYLDFEAAFLPTFHPAYFEYAIEPECAVDYAGYALMGRVDRIDVDEAGHAVIVDYKGSVGSAHCIAGKTPEYMGKVQTRMYAQAVKRALGLDVVGAFYVTYGRKPQVMGAYDPTVIETAHLPGIREGQCACAAADGGAPQGLLEPDAALADFTFAHMLDATESVVGQAIARMLAGDVGPAPSSSEVCTYCVAPACGKRGDA